MQVWLVRHTDAVSEEEDPRRPLSAKGREAACELGRFFRRNGALAQATICWHSPLVRARETAELVLREACVKAPRKERAGLLPEDDPAEIAVQLEKMRDPDAGVVLVGHEPHLSALGTLLVGGEPQTAQFRLRKGAVLALTPAGEAPLTTGAHRRWVVQWLLAPALVRAKESGQ
jgi:phosphohistidine phosphatase